MIPPLIVPFRMIRAEYLVMLTLPAIASFNPMVLVESNRLNLLLLPLLRRHSRRMTGNIRSRRGSISRFLVRAILPAFSGTGLIRRFIGRFAGDVRFWGVCRFVARVSFLALFRVRLICGPVLIRRAAFLHRSGLLRWPLLRLRGVRAGLC